MLVVYFIAAVATAAADAAVEVCTKYPSTIAILPLALHPAPTVLLLLLMCQVEDAEDEAGASGGRAVQQLLRQAHVGSREELDKKIADLTSEVERWVSGFLGDNDSDAGIPMGCKLTHLWGTSL